MQRRARNIATGAALAITLTGGLTACTGGSTPEDGDESSPGKSTTTAPEAPPGTYRTLPEPCGAVAKATLKSLLPGVEPPDGDKSTDPYEGKPALTYDTDRRAGCSWKGSTAAGSHHLSVDLERVVSYDPSVSDNEQAERMFDKRAEKAGIPTGEDSPGTASPESSAPGSASPGSGEDDGADKDGADEEGKKDKAGEESGKGGEKDGSEAPEESASSEETGTSSPSPSPDEDLSPRMLTGLGDSAWIDDELATADTGVHRDITLLFRSGNVLATVRYEEWPTTKEDTPDSRELQEKTQRAASDLSRRFDES